MDKQDLIQQIKASTKEIPCDLVIKNIRIIDVFQGNSYIDTVGIKNGYFVGIGDYSGIKEIDGTGKFMCPSLIDAHAHLESSLITPNEYYKYALLHGITSMVVDPHEIANVLGINGIKLMLEMSENIPFDFYYMLPSCVPATNFESSGAIIESNDLKPLYEHPKVLGLAEVMNFPSVINTDEKMINKLYDAISKNKIIDGHCAGFNNQLINSYRTANIITDHECKSAEEVLDRIRRGMYVLLREGTVAKNLKDLIRGTTISNSRRVCLCTDDKHIDDLIKYGSIDHSIKIITSLGLTPENAIQMGTLNTAECYKLKNKGAIAPGYIADFLILDDIYSFTINSVYKNGELVVYKNKLVSENKNKNTVIIKNSINIKNISKNDLAINIENKNILNVIQIIPNKLETIKISHNISNLNDKNFISSIENDLLKVCVIERHNATGNIGLGIINGIKLKSGAIATTIAHDSHNIIVTGTNDDDMIFAIEKLKDIHGGIIVVENGKVLASISLEIGGIITGRKTNEVLLELENLHIATQKIAPDINFNPFLTLSFLTLPVIPELKITDKGIFDMFKFDFIPIAE